MPLVSACASRPARLASSDPDARILGYAYDAVRMPPGDINFTAGSACANCAHYQQQSERDDHAPCLTFENRSVPNTGDAEPKSRGPKANSARRAVFVSRGMAPVHSVLAAHHVKVHMPAQFSLVVFLLHKNHVAGRVCHQLFGLAADQLQI